MSKDIDRKLLYGVVRQGSAVHALIVVPYLVIVLVLLILVTIPLGIAHDIFSLLRKSLFVLVSKCEKSMVDKTWLLKGWTRHIRRRW